MDAATLNDIGITVAGILGIVMFYFIGRSVSRNQAGKNADQGNGASPEDRNGSSGADLKKK